MIWHERDGQRHVGHPGGLPGFGTLMRWVPELGLSVILLANVTYAKCEWPVRRALALIAREAALPRRIIRADPGLLAARDAIDGLVERWDDGVAARLFSPNVDLDRPLSERRAELAGAARSPRRAHPRRRLRARGRAARKLAAARRARPRRARPSRWPRPCRRSCRRSRSSPSCRRPARLGELAAAAVQLASEPDAAALDGAARTRHRRRAEALRGAASRRRALRPVRRARGHRRRRRDDHHAAPPGPPRKRRPRARARRERRPPGDASLLRPAPAEPF